MKKIIASALAALALLAIPATAVAKGNPTFGSGGTGAFKAWCINVVHGDYSPPEQTCNGANGYFTP